jgi:hypothetical protein
MDLANMLLCLALRIDPERVHGRATAVFIPTRSPRRWPALGLTIPTELQAKIKADGLTRCWGGSGSWPRPTPRSPSNAGAPSASPSPPARHSASCSWSGLFLDSLRAGLTWVCSHQR